jgi:hypothetical protein
MKGMMQDPKDKKAIMADAYSDKRVNELKKATNTPYQMKMASMVKKPSDKVVDKYMPTADELRAVRDREAKAFAKIRARDAEYKLGSMKKKSFPDLNKDGKVTKADILKGRGVIK